MRRAIEETAPPARDPGGLQPRARHRSRVDRQADQLAPRADVEPRLLRSLASTPRPELPDAESVRRRIAELEKQMKAAAKELDFERAAALRDEIRGLRELEIFRA